MQKNFAQIRVPKRRPIKKPYNKISAIHNNDGKKSYRKIKIFEISGSNFKRCKIPYSISHDGAGIDNPKTKYLLWKALDPSAPSIKSGTYS